ncbi:MAG: hypothetical protein XD95_0094 [Microgenomates bacterium 39_7]|nr:MAG: hypothetical protein XD95_0094 [Microgenomates bacterium 39_7]
MHQIKVASVVGSPLENSWSQLVFSPDRRLVCTLGIKGSNAKNIGFEFAQQLENQEDLSAAAVHNFILDLLKKARELEVSLNLALLGFIQSKQDNNQPKATLAAYQGQILLKRENRVGIILKSESEINIIEGSLKQGDEFFLGTAQTEQLEQSIKQLFKTGLSPDALASNLNQKVQMLVNSSLLASAIVKIEEVEYPKIKPQIEELKVSKALMYQQNSYPSEEPNLDEVDDTLTHQTNEKLTSKKKNEKNKLDEKLESSTKASQENFNQQNLMVHDELKYNRKDETQVESSNQDEAEHKKFEGGDFLEDETKEIKIRISLDPLKQISGLGIEKLRILFSQIGKMVKKGATQLKARANNIAKQKQLNSSGYNNGGDLLNTKTENSPLIQPSANLGTTPKQATRFSKIIKQLPKPVKILNLINPTKIFSKSTEVYLGKTSKIKKGKIAVIISVILLIILAVNFVSASISSQKQQIQQELEPAQELLHQAKLLEDENILQARDMAAQAIETALATQKELGNPRLTRREFDEFIESAQSYFNEIDGQVEVSQLEIFLDLREVFPNFITSATTSNTRYLFFIDRQQNQLIALRISDRQAYRMYLEEELEISDFTASPNELFILNSGIYTLSLNEINNSEELDWSEDLTLIKEEGDSDRESIFIDYYEGFLYVFNPVRRNIFRYIVRDNELSDPIGWITNSQGIEFASITSLTIDGQVWLTSNNGDIFRLERGVPLEFEIRGLDDLSGSSISIHTNQDSENLYILESAKNRLVILTKSGEFIRQIVSPSLAATTHIEVNEEIGKAFVVSGSIVYEIAL